MACTDADFLLFDLASPSAGAHNAQPDFLSSDPSLCSDGPFSTDTASGDGLLHEELSFSRGGLHDDVSLAALRPCLRENSTTSQHHHAGFESLMAEPMDWAIDVEPEPSAVACGRAPPSVVPAAATPERAVMAPPKSRARKAGAEQPDAKRSRRANNNHGGGDKPARRATSSSFSGVLQPFGLVKAYKPRGGGAMSLTELNEKIRRLEGKA